LPLPRRTVTREKPWFPEAPGLARALRQGWRDPLRSPAMPALVARVLDVTLVVAILTAFT